MSAVTERLVAADRGVRRLRRYLPDVSPAGSATSWRGMCLTVPTASGAEHVFADGADLLADLPMLHRDAVEAVRRVLSGEPGQHGQPGPDDVWAAQVADRHRVELVRADFRQRVAVGPTSRLTIDERALTTIEVLDAEDGTSAELVQWQPGDVAGSRRRVEEAAETVRRTAALPVVPLPRTRCDLVLDPGWAGPFFHELVGHPLEGDVVASGSSYLAGRTGEQLAPSWLTVTDGPAPEGEGLRATVDDEGTPLVTTALVENGRVAGPLHDRLTRQAARPPGRTGEHPVPRPGGPASRPAATGHGRRLDYRHPVVPRMWHTRACAAGVLPEEPAAAVRLHPRGVQLSWMNLLTGEAEFRCPGGLLDSGEANLRRTGPFTFSGQARALLAALRPGAPAVRGGGRARKGCGKLGQFPLVTTFSNSGLWIPGEVVDVRDDRGW